MRKAILGGIIFFTMIVITACSGKDVITQQVGLEQMELKKQDIEVYIQQEVTSGLCEPESGVYLGAYVEKNINLDNNIKNFEQTIGHEQAFRVFQYSGLGSVGSSDILACIANKQTPYIKVMMDENYDTSQIYQMIGDIRSSYSSTIFIELYPVTSKVNNPVEYKQHYEEAYKIIKKYIKNAVIVWSVDLEKSQESMSYYPGNHLVDWVGMNIYLPQYKGEKAYNPAIHQSIDFWYKNFQDKKPMLISSLAVSYFSRVDHTYAIEAAKNKLNLFYTDIVHAYPRIKGILYIDVDMKEVSKEGLEDYRISSHSQIMSHMKEILADGIFLHEAKKSEGETQKEYLKYTVPAITHSGKTYIPEEYTQNLFGGVKIKAVERIEDLSGNVYYSLNQLIEHTPAYYTK
ncbi:MAG: glycosyl hydrolase [Cellulosilyticaceae bacterium]